MRPACWKSPDSMKVSAISNWAWWRNPVFGKLGLIDAEGGVRTL